MDEKTPLTEAEWHIISCLWRRQPRTIMQLTRDLHDETGWTKYTVIALLKRMQAKGTVRLEAGGRATNVYAQVSRERACTEQTHTLLNRLFDGKVSALVCNMVDRQELSSEELDELSAIIARAKEEQREGER